MASGVHLVQPLLQVGPPKAGCTGPCPDGFGVSPRMNTPQVPFTGFEMRGYFSKDCFHVYNLRTICTSTAERAVSCNRERNSVKIYIASRQELLELALFPGVI